MIRLLIAIVLVSCSRPSAPQSPDNQVAATPDAAVAGLPAEVTALVARWEECWHWAGEEPYDADRRKQIEEGVARSCPGNDEERERLRTKYQGRRDILDALRKLDEMQ